VSVFVDASYLGLLVTMSGMAAISSVVLTRCVEEEDSGSAKIWASVFGRPPSSSLGTSGGLCEHHENEPMGAAHGSSQP
jgi:hypothetical protein